LEEAYNIVAPKLLTGEGPTGTELHDAVTRLIAQLELMARLQVTGEPAEPAVLARLTRLSELLPIVKDRLQHLDAQHRQSFGVRVADVIEVITLARVHSSDQRDAILDKLSRGYQKPDFCIRRDAVGEAADSLLSAELSWDADWYFGTDIPGRPSDFPPAFPPASATQPSFPLTAVRRPDIGPRTF
jgi:hypothetical protein